MSGQSKPSPYDVAVENQRLTFALQAAGVGTWDLDLIRQQVWWDDRCKELYGVSQADTVPYEQVLSYMHPDDQQRVNQAVQWALNPQSGGQYDIRFRTLGTSQTVRWLHCKGQAYFDSAGKPYRFVGIAQDITQDQLTRQQLQTSEDEFRRLSMSLLLAEQQRKQELTVFNEEMTLTNKE